MDFRNDMKLMTSSLRTIIGEDNVRPFYGKGMTHDEKRKTDSDFRAKDFQVLVATESYEVGTQSTRGQHFPSRLYAQPKCYCTANLAEQDEVVTTPMDFSSSTNPKTIID